MNITQEGEEQVTWINLITQERDIVIKGSTKDKEYNKRLNDIGFWDINDPNKPENCMSQEEFEKYLKAQKEITIEERLTEYNKRKNLKDADGR